MKTIITFFSSGPVLLFIAMCLLVNNAGGDERPNIILAMADDMGWHDLSCYGNDRVATPNIDRLAKEGIKLNQFYSASAVCTPTRVPVLTSTKRKTAQGKSRNRARAE